MIKYEIQKQVLSSTVSINTQSYGRFWTRLWENKEVTAFARRVCPSKEKYKRRSRKDYAPRGQKLSLT